jgi:hypothetical protein
MKLALGFGWSGWRLIGGGAACWPALSLAAKRPPVTGLEGRPVWASPQAMPGDAPPPHPLTPGPRPAAAGHGAGVSAPLPIPLPCARPGLDGPPGRWGGAPPRPSPPPLRRRAWPLDGARRERSPAARDRAWMPGTAAPPARWQARAPFTIRRGDGDGGWSQGSAGVRHVRPWAFGGMAPAACPARHPPVSQGILRAEPPCRPGAGPGPQARRPAAWRGRHNQAGDP